MGTGTKKKSGGLQGASLLINDGSGKTIRAKTPRERIKGINGGKKIARSRKVLLVVTAIDTAT